MLNQSRQGLDRAEVIRTGQGSAGLGSSGQNWAGLLGQDKTGQVWAGQKSIARQGLRLWKELLKERECSLFPACLETAIPEPILPAYQRPACPVFIVDCELQQRSHGLKRAPLKILAQLSCTEQRIIFLVGKDHLNLICPLSERPFFLENSSLLFKTQYKLH